MRPAALLVLFLAIVSEVVGTAGLKASEGFSKTVPVVVEVVTELPIAILSLDRGSRLPDSYAPYSFPSSVVYAVEPACLQGFVVKVNLARRCKC